MKFIVAVVWLSVWLLLFIRRKFQLQFISLLTLLDSSTVLGCCCLPTIWLIRYKSIFIFICFQQPFIHCHFGVTKFECVDMKRFVMSTDFTIWISIKSSVQCVFRLEINWKWSENARTSPAYMCRICVRNSKVMIFQGTAGQREENNKKSKYEENSTIFPSNCSDGGESFSSCAIIYEAILFSMKFTILFPSHRGREFMRT